MIDRDDIARAARNADALAEEIGLADFIARHDIDLDGLLYVCNQRALRLGLIAEGRNPNPSPGKPVGIDLKPETERLLPTFAAAWLDGFLAGLLSRHDSSHDIPGIDLSRKEQP